MPVKPSPLWKYSEQLREWRKGKRPLSWRKIAQRLATDEGLKVSMENVYQFYKRLKRKH
jgi:hypothetical protein